MSIVGCALKDLDFSCHSLKSFLDQSQGKIKGIRHPSLFIHSLNQDVASLADITTRIWNLAASQKWSIPKADLEVWMDVMEELKKIVEKTKSTTWSIFSYEKTFSQILFELEVLKKAFTAVDSAWRFADKNHLVSKAKEGQKPIYVLPKESGLQGAICIFPTGKIEINFRRSHDP